MPKRARGAHRRAVLDVAALVAPEPVHRGDAVHVLARAGRDRGAQTGVTDGNADDAVARRTCRARITFASTGAWPVSTARRTIAGFMPSTTARTSFTASTRRPAYFSPERRRPPCSSQARKRDDDRSTAAAASTAATAASAPRPRRRAAARPRACCVETRAHAREEVARRCRGEHGARARRAIQPITRAVAVVRRACRRRAGRR